MSEAADRKHERMRHWAEPGSRHDAVIRAVKYGLPLDFTKERAEAKNCPKARLKEIYQQVAERLMREIAKLAPCAELSSFPEPGR